MNKKLALLAPLALILGACSQSSNKETTKTPTLSQEKIQAVIQSQTVISQFSNDSKSSAEEKQPARNQRLSTNQFFAAAATQWLATGGPSQGRFNQKEAQTKSTNMQRKVKNAGCALLLKTPTTMSSNSATSGSYTMEISGNSQCPLKLTQTVAIENQDNGKKLNLLISFDYQSLDEELSKETDVKSMKLNATIAIEMENPGQSSVGKMTMSFGYDVQGESVTQGAYSLSSKISMDTIPEIHSQNGYKRIFIELASQMTVGSELGTVYSKMHYEDGKIQSQVRQVNGADVNDDEFKDAASAMMTIPGFNLSSSSGSSSSSGEDQPSQPTPVRPKS